MKHTTLSIKEISKELEPYKITLSKKDLVELIETEKYKIILINKELSFFYYQDKLVPLLKYLLAHHILLQIVIDMGAVKFIVNGADVMRPGMVEVAEGIKKDDFIVVVDKNNKKPLAVGIALFSSEEMKAMVSGKVIKNIHYVGDGLWKVVV